MVLISAGLTSLSLLLVRQSVQSQVRQEIVSDLRNSVTTFGSFQQEQEITLSHSADLLADLPNLRALMTTNHEATIQDGSTPLWQLTGSDLFVLADRSGKVVALHTNSPGFTKEMAQNSMNCLKWPGALVVWSEASLRSLLEADLFRTRFSWPATGISGNRPRD